MKLLKGVLGAALMLAAVAHAQEPRPDAPKADPAQAAMSEFYDCAKTYSEKYAKSREPAQDIADAALSYCETPRERARTLLIDKLSVGGRSAREQVNSLFPGIIEKARLLSIRTVVEARYEATLRASIVPAPAPAPAPLPLTGPGTFAEPAPITSTEAPAPPLQPAPAPAFAVPPLTSQPGEAVPMPYIDTTQPGPSSASGPARPDPGGLPPEVLQ